jgi:fatty acid desaturase
VDRSDPRSLAGALRKALPAEVFLPATSRLLWIPLHVAVVLGLTLLAKHGLTSGWSAWFLLPASVAIGLSFAGLAFVAHEALHGALTRRRGLRKLAG